MNNRNVPSCCAQIGLLVLHRCGKKAVGICDGCALPFCSRHLLETETGERMCPSCIDKAGAKVAGSGSEAVDRYRKREEYYRTNSYPHLYTYYNRFYYYDHDYAIVDHTRAQSNEEVPADDESMVDGDYDFTES